MTMHQDDLASYLGPILDGGFARLDELIEYALDYADDTGEVTKEEAKSLAEELWRARLEEQSAPSWAESADVGRLKNAFDILNQNNIVAKMNFTCCNSCGNLEIFDQNSDGTAVGYLFFHSQSADSMAETGNLYLNYGSFKDDSDEATRQIGVSATQYLRAAGLKVDWDEDPSRKIIVTDLLWLPKLPV